MEVDLLSFRKNGGIRVKFILLVASKHLNTAIYNIQTFFYRRILGIQDT